MARKIKYYLVAAEALPEIFIRVAEAKRMMQTGEADTVGAATKMAGISRSAFYKYKDAVRPFQDMLHVTGGDGDVHHLEFLLQGALSVRFIE